VGIAGLNLYISNSSQLHVLQWDKYRFSFMCLEMLVYGSLNQKNVYISVADVI